MKNVKLNKILIKTVSKDKEEGIAVVCVKNRFFKKSTPVKSRVLTSKKSKNG
jgi:hypothetical protein